MTTPFETPTAFDTITLNTVEMRGQWKRVGGGERTRKIEQVQAPGFLGAFTIARQVGMVDIEYLVRVINHPDYQWLQTMLEVLEAGMAPVAPRGPTVYDLQDLTMTHLKCRRVACSKLTLIKHVGKGAHETLIGFAEWKKKVPVGPTPAARPKSDIEKQIDQINADNKALQQQLDAIKKGAK